MPDVRIEDLTTLAAADVAAAADTLAIEDDSADEVKKITAAALVEGGGGLLADGSVPLSGALLDSDGRDVGAPTIETLSGTSETLADDDHGKVKRCTNASTILITVPSGLTPGTTVEYLQEGAGQVQIAGSGVTLRHGATFDPYTNEQWSSVVVTVLDTDEALVRGDLAAA